MENGTVVMDWICRIISPFPKCGTRNEVEVPVHYFSFEMDFFPLIQVAEISPQVLKWMTKTGWFSVEPFSCAIQIMGAKDLTHLKTTKILWFILIFHTPIATWAPHFCLQTSKKNVFSGWGESLLVHSMPPFHFVAPSHPTATFCRSRSPKCVRNASPQHATAPGQTRLDKKSSKSPSNHLQMMEYWWIYIYGYTGYSWLIEMASLEMEYNWMNTGSPRNILRSNPRFLRKQAWSTSVSWSAQGQRSTQSCENPVCSIQVCICI